MININDVSAWFAPKSICWMFVPVLIRFKNERFKVTKQKATCVASHPSNAPFLPPPSLSPLFPLSPSVSIHPLLRRDREGKKLFGLSNWIFLQLCSNFRQNSPSLPTRMNQFLTRSLFMFMKLGFSGALSISLLPFPFKFLCFFFFPASRSSRSIPLLTKDDPSLKEKL